MEQAPPPFFKRGPAPVVRLFFFASLSLALAVLDARFRYADGLRSALALAAYPLQKIATAPIALAERVGGYFGRQSQLREENSELRATALGIAHANLENSTSLLPRLGEFMAGLADGLLGMAIAMTIMLTAYVLLELYSNDDMTEDQR